MATDKDVAPPGPRKARWLKWVLIGLCLPCLAYLAITGPYVVKHLVRMYYAPRSPGPDAPVVLKIDWAHVSSPRDGVPLSITGELMSSTPERPSKAIAQPISGQIDGWPAHGLAVGLAEDISLPATEVHRSLATCVEEDGRPVVLIEGTSEVNWQLRAVNVGGTILVARQESQVSPLPLDFQPGPFHIRVEAHALPVLGLHRLAPSQPASAPDAK